MYGAGLAEIRLARYLAQHNRDDHVLSTKVGRLVLDEIDTDERDTEMFKFGRANRVAYDYTEKGALKSIEGSLNRLGVDRLDFVFVHDPAQDFHGDGWLAQLETARTGAFRALTRLRDEGVIGGWGLGVNLTEPVEFTLGLTDVQPDGTLLAGRYTLLDHEHALQRLMPTAAAQGIDIVIGGPYNSGILAGGTRFEYQNAPAEITAKVARITDIAQRYDVPIKAAALQFSLAHPATAAVIPDDFWHELRDQHLVAANAPLPIDR
jgi:D-threo-aldose 1-dehydrogenase